MKVKITTGDLRELTADEKIIHKPYCYVITEDWVCKTHKGIVTVKRGFLSDGASGGPDYGCSWIFHDWLYSTHKYDDGTEISREEVDNLMKTILTLECMGWYVWIFNKLSVWNIFYLFSKAWASSGARGPEFLELPILAEDLVVEQQHQIDIGLSRNSVDIDSKSQLDVDNNPCEANKQND